MSSVLNFLLNILAIVTLAALLYYAVKHLQREGFVSSSYPPVTFLSAAETKQFFQEDYDEYVHTLSQWDLLARHVATFQDYINKISKSSMSFTEEQKDRLRKAAFEADEFFRTTSINGIDCEKIQFIPWIFGLTRGIEYEDGLPHTRADKIFISTILDQVHSTLVRTLIHEKVHLYQRLHPGDMMAWLEQNRYYRWKQRFGVPRIRANPDLDPWIYFDPNTKKPMTAFYVSDNPANINDVILDSPLSEHPYELVAYKIAEKYDNKIKLKAKGI